MCFFPIVIDSLKSDYLGTKLPFHHFLAVRPPPLPVESLNISRAQFLYLQSGDNKRVFMIIKEDSKTYKGLEQCPACGRYSLNTVVWSFGL